MILKYIESNSSIASLGLNALREYFLEILKVGYDMVEKTADVNQNIILFTCDAIKKSAEEEKEKMVKEGTASIISGATGILVTGGATVASAKAANTAKKQNKGLDRIDDMNSARNKSSINTGTPSKENTQQKSVDDQLDDLDSNDLIENTYKDRTFKEKVTFKEKELDQNRYQEADEKELTGAYLDNNQKARYDSIMNKKKRAYDTKISQANSTMQSSFAMANTLNSSFNSMVQGAATVWASDNVVKKAEFDARSRLGDNAGDANRSGAQTQQSIVDKYAEQVRAIDSTINELNSTLRLRG